jgi:opacity protein-like surface antigen
MVSQVVPSGEEGRLPLVVGAGATYFYLDWGHDALGHRRGMMGGTMWADWNLYDLPHYLNGFGVEVEARELRLNGPIELTTDYVFPNCTPTATNPCKNLFSMRHDTAEGGAIYTMRRWVRFQPYGKFLAGFGSMDFPTNVSRPDGTPYSHDTRTIYVPGGGLNYRITRHVAMRIDYEYQFWPHFLGHQNTLNPNGLSVGATYGFSPFHKHGRPGLAPRTAPGPAPATP